MTDYRAELQRLVKAYDEHGGRWPENDVQALFNAVEVARAALAQPEPEDLVNGECFIVPPSGPPRWERIAIEPVPVADLPPRVGHVFRLAEIIREVDGNHDKGAAALAEAILSHAGSMWSPATEPVPVAERPWEREGWCDAEGRCWLHRPAKIPCRLANGTLYRWVLDTPYWDEEGPLHDTHSLPHHALPIPSAEME